MSVRQRIGLVMVTCLAWAQVAAQNPPGGGPPPGAGAFKPVPQEPVALVHAHVVNVRTGTIVRDATVVLRGGRIESVGSAGQPPAPAGVRTVDLRGKYLLPGLIDAHTHLADFASARLALESGVTTVRSSGCRTTRMSGCVSWRGRARSPGRTCSRRAITCGRVWPTRRSSAIRRSRR